MEPAASLTTQQGNLGGAIFILDNTVLIFDGATCSNFTNNSADSGGVIYTGINNTLTFKRTVNFINNGHYWDAVDTQNEYIYGGGMYIGVRTTFSILYNTTVYWRTIMQL